MVTISDEACEFDILARSGTWPGDVCAPRIVVKVTCSASRPALEALEKKGRMHALRVQKLPARSVPKLFPEREAGVVAFASQADAMSRNVGLPRRRRGKE